MAIFDWAAEIKRRIEGGADAVKEVNRWARDQGIADTSLDSIPDADVTSFYNEVVLIMAEARNDRIAITEAEHVIYIESGGVIH